MDTTISRGWGRGSVLWVFLIWASLAVAQLDTGTISGRVTDQSGGAVPGAAITIRNLDTGIARSLETNAAGRYEAVALPVGTYEVRASLAGFQTLVRSGITLTVGRNAVVDLALQVGEVAQAITVAGEASFVETTTATVSNLVDEKRVSEIPLNNRDLTQLAYLQPGVLKVPQSSSSAVNSAIAGQGDKLSVAGARATQNIYLTDGVSNSDISGNAQGAAGNYAGAETIKEFQIITNNYSAEYASRAGAIVSAVTKSGTNAFHGTLFEFLRNDNLDAAKWEDNALGRTKPEFKRNQLGGSLGGPILRDRTFFFASYEALRERRGTTGTATVLTAAGRAGDLGPNGPVNPATGTRIWPVNPVVRPYFGLWPLPGEEGTALVRDFGDGRALVSGIARRPVNDDFGTVKLDHQFASQRKGFLAFTYTIDDARADSFHILPNAFSAFGTTSRKHVISGRHTSILSPTALNELTFGYTKARPVSANLLSGVDWTNFNGANLRFRPDVPVMGRVSPGDGIQQLGAQARPNIFENNLLSFRESLSLTRPRHTLKFGAEIQHIGNPMQWPGDSSAGDYAFDRLALFLQGRPRTLSTPLPKGATFLEGQTALQIADYDFRQSLLGFYLQDNYAVLPSLTLNLGLRYEFMTLPKEADGNLGTMRSFFDNRVTVGPPFTNPTLKNFSPRVGFAWAPGSKKTSLRGGFGIYYDPPLLFNWSYNLTAQPPFNVEGGIEDPASTGLIRFPDAFTTQAGLLASTPLMRYPEYDQAPTTIYRWSLTLNREIGPWFFSAGYTGSRAVHLWLIYEGNMYKWDGWPNDVPSGQKRFQRSNGLISPAFSRITVQAPSGNSYYHGLTVNVMRRLSAGLQFQAAYSYSKNIDQGSSPFNQVEKLPQGQSTSYYWDKAMVRGNSALDIRNNFVTNVTYEIPGTGLTGFAGAVASGWQVSAILTLSGGFPFSLIESSSAQTAAFFRMNGLRPNLIPGGNNNPVRGGPSLYYDPTQFVSSTCTGARDCRAGDPDYRVGYFGNLGYNTLTAPGLATFDFSVLKNLKVSESKRLQFRAEFFNLFNRVNFGLPGASPFLSNGTRDSEAGKIRETRTTARQIQFGLKFIF